MRRLLSSPALASSAFARAALVVSVTAAVAATWSCTDFDAPPSTVLADTLVAEPSFARDVQPIFTARCATQACHNLATRQSDLNLDAAHAYDDLVDRPAVLSPEGFVRVHPGDADGSWLVRMVEADDARRFDNVRMPLGRPPLTERQIGTIVNWITQGAHRN